MKDLKTKERFIVLRAEGRSFESIAEELNVSKTTLITWSQKLNREINNARYLAYQRLIEQYKMTKIDSINSLMQQLQKINNAIDEKDIKELSYKDLILLKEKLINQLNGEASKMRYQTGEFNEGLSSLIDSINKSEITIPLE
jgi:transposase